MTLQGEIKLREHLLGWHHGRYHVGRCGMCATEYRRVRRAAGLDVSVRTSAGVTTAASVARGA